MPKLDSDQLERMRAVKPIWCEECLTWTARNYCRNCDEYFDGGHYETCSTTKIEGQGSNNHGSHDTY